MQLNIKSLLFLIAAVIFGVAFLLGWAGDPYAAWHPRIVALAWCLMAVAFFIWAAGG